ncbi:MAG: hypothetical protein EBX37_06490, partial [Alphaproteobacteria bacterium]|nr:hypothetical protein [Alphaproteobacteria bacterium]
IADYYLSLWMPPGYGLLQRLWAQWFDPRLLHRYLPLLLWLACLPSAYVAGARLRGRVNGWATALLFSGSSIFIFRLNGGMAHGFAFPLTWWAVAALLSGRAVQLAACAILAAALYPVVAPVVGMTLALWMLFPRLAPAIPRAAQQNLPLLKKLLWLAMPGAAVLALMAPMLVPQAGAYGEVIDLRRQWQDYPEATQGFAVINPFIYFVSAFALQHMARLGDDAGQALTLGVFALLLAGVLLHDARDRRPGSLKPYAYAAVFFFLLSLLFAYQHAYRFAIYNLPVLITLYLPLVLRQLCNRVLPRRAQVAGFAFLLLAYIGCIAQAEERASSYYLRLEDWQVRALDFIGTLPKDAMLAGWPGDRYGRIIEAVPYVAQRSALVTWGGHTVAHRAYVLELREKMFAVTEAYLARDAAPLIALRERFGVDYLVVNAQDFSGHTPPLYIAPFNARAEALWQQAQGHFYVLGEGQKAAVYQDGNIAVLDLHKL